MIENSHAELLCFSHLRWKFVFQRPQHLLVRWAKVRRVFYFEEPVFREGVNELVVDDGEASGVVVCTPHLRPGLAPAEILSEQHRMLNDLVTHHNISKDVVLWYYTPMALQFSKQLTAAAIVYDCMDELSAFQDAPPALRENERQLLARADVMFTGGHSLYEAKRDAHHNVHPFPSAVDVSHFAQARSLMREPKDQATIPHPRLGFYGVLDERLDTQLLKELADRRPDWHLVLLGPVAKIELAALPQRPNVHYLGHKTYAELPSYLAGWDVALLPFARNESTRFISPTKTPEYLAGGKPVVSTSIRDVVQPYGEMGLAHIADSAADFERAIETAMQESSTERVVRTDAFLADRSWDATWREMASLVEQAVVETQAPFERVSHIRPPKPVYDYMVVGAGFAGSVIAERLAEASNKKVLLVDKRPHVGGNAYDHYDEAGVLVHKYGPHIFHTNSSEVFEYLSRFTEWRPYEHRVLASVAGKLLPVPINLDTVNGLYNWSLDSDGLEEFFGRVGEPRPSIRTSEDVVISKVGRDLYEKFFKNYTRKQWGLDPSELDPTVIARIPVRTNRDSRYFTDKFQAMPKHGFTAMFDRIVRHPNITVELGVDYRDVLTRVTCHAMVYSGPVDAFFNYCYGRLPYRSLDFKFETHAVEQYQQAAVINYPNDHDYTRVTEFKHLTGQKLGKTSIVYEYPCAEGEPYYPIPRPENAALYAKYQALAKSTVNVHFVGRLGTYRYYNMDQVTAQALTLAAKLHGVSRRVLLGNAATGSAG